MKLTSNTILITGGAVHRYELTKQLHGTFNTILIRSDQAKMDRAKAAFPKLHHLSKRRFRSEAIATLYEEVIKQFPELNILITTRRHHA